MSGSEGRIDWPRFARRTDFDDAGAEPLLMHVCHKYTSGFDARCGERLFFFTAERAALHPLAILIPASVIDMVAADTKILLSAGCLQFMDTNCQNRCLYESEPVNVLPFCDHHQVEVVRDNLLVLISNLKLFGRRSLVLDLILGCNTEKNILSAAEAIILAPNPDLQLLSAFVGAGEGLTPAFDDFLSGMLLADRFASLDQIKVPDGFFELAGSKTTVQALQQLTFAARGRLSLRFEACIAALLQRPIKSAEVVKVLHYGHSSGTDILCGIWHHLNQAYIGLNKKARC